MKGRKVYLILDNLRVHHSKPVKAWLEVHQEAIAVHHLPSNSLELNPDERLSRSLNSTLSHLPSAKDDRSLQKQIIGKLRSCQKQPERIRFFFTSSSTLYVQWTLQGLAPLLLVLERRWSSAAEPQAEPERKNQQ